MSSNSVVRFDTELDSSAGSAPKDRTLDLSLIPKVSRIRRDNLIKLRTLHGATSLSRILGYGSPSFLSQMVGPNPSREVTEKSARKFERLLALPLGALDRTDFDPTAPGEPTCRDGKVDLPISVYVGPTILSALDLVNNVCAKDKIVLSDGIRRQTQDLTHLQAQKSGVMPSQTFVRDLIYHLLKAAAAL